MKLKKRVIAALATVAALIAGGGFAATANADGFTQLYYPTPIGGGVDVSSMKTSADCYGNDAKVEWTVHISPFMASADGLRTSNSAAIWLPKYVKNAAFAVTSTAGGVDSSATPSTILQIEQEYGNSTPQEAAHAFYAQENS